MWQNHTQLTNIDPLETDLWSAAEFKKFIIDSCQMARAANLMRDFEADAEDAFAPVKLSLIGFTLIIGKKGNGI